MYARWICKLALPHGFPYPSNIHALTADDPRRFGTERPPNAQEAPRMDNATRQRAFALPINSDSSIFSNAKVLMIRVGRPRPRKTGSEL